MKKLTITAVAVSVLLSACGATNYVPSSGGTSTTATVDSSVPTTQDIIDDTVGNTPDVESVDPEVETIDPGPVDESYGVVDTNGNGSSDDEADNVTSEGVTEDGLSDAVDDATETEEDDSTTNGGNDGVDIF